jgi:hypothetical protein
VTAEIIAIAAGIAVAVEVGPGDTILDVRRRACVTAGYDDGQRWEVRDPRGALVDQSGPAVAEDGQPIFDRVFVNLAPGVGG